MNLKYNNWKPDTCDCLIEEKKDLDDPQAGLSFSKVISKCVVHQGIADESLYAVILTNTDSDQRRKNGIEKKLLEDTSLSLSDLNANGAYTFKNGVEYKWSFSGEGASRVLTIQVVGKTLTNNQKNNITAWLNTNFGVGKVVIQ